MHFIEKKAGQKRIDFDNKLKLILNQVNVMGYGKTHIGASERFSRAPESLGELQ